ncbi:MAG: regulatory protein RecX [Pseudomonadota bacterium]|nr:regulatory protein RecX [Pseudomonadota bacterium]
MRPRTTLETPADIRRSAMDLLARREHSYAELQRKLRQRGASGDMAEVELDRLVEDGLLSDERFCEAYIYARSQRGYGPSRLREELRQRGVPESLVERSLAEADQDWQALADQVFAKRFPEGVAREPAERGKQLRFMQYRGFSGFRAD